LPVAQWVTGFSFCLVADRLQIVAPEWALEGVSNRSANVGSVSNSGWP
jgi:hypothetical protein